MEGVEVWSRTGGKTEEVSVVTQTRKSASKAYRSKHKIPEHTSNKIKQHQNTQIKTYTIPITILNKPSFFLLFPLPLHIRPNPPPKHTTEAMPILPRRPHTTHKSPLRHRAHLLGHPPHQFVRHIRYAVHHDGKGGFRQLVRRLEGL